MLAPPGGTELLRGHAEQQKTTSITIIITIIIIIIIWLLHILENSYVNSRSAATCCPLEELVCVVCLEIESKTLLVLTVTPSNLISFLKQ